MIPNSDEIPVSGVESILCETQLIIGNYDYDLFNKNTKWKCEANSSEALAQKLKDVITETTDKIKFRTSTGKVNNEKLVDICSEMKKLIINYYSISREVN